MKHSSEQCKANDSTVNPFIASLPSTHCPATSQGLSVVTLSPAVADEGSKVLAFRAVLLLECFRAC